MMNYLVISTVISICFSAAIINHIKQLPRLANRFPRRSLQSYLTAVNLVDLDHINPVPVQTYNTINFHKEEQMTTRNYWRKVKSLISPVTSTFSSPSFASSNIQHQVTGRNIFLIMGGPGCGKGTQCSLLAEEFNMVHISVGNLLREESRKAGPLSEYIRKCIQNGDLVPNGIALNILEKKLRQIPASQQILLDGYPRDLGQAIDFHEKFGHVNGVLQFSCKDSVLQERLLERGKTSGREDDNLITIKNRIKFYNLESDRVIKFYANHEKIFCVDADRALSDIYKDTKRIIQENHHNYENDDYWYNEALYA